MKIDFVLPWVNPMDKEWQKSKEFYSKQVNKDIEGSSARYRDMETLKYVLRSIEQNCPWYNKIYLITEGHYPEWLDLESDKLVLVSHSKLYFDKSHLPTFNSNSIEMNLLNIPNLSDYFVYLNDDLFIMKQTDISRFFVDGKVVDFLSHGWFARNELFDKIKPIGVWGYSVRKTLNLINKELGVGHLEYKHLFDKSYSIKEKISNFLMKYVYKKALRISHWHYAQPYTKKTLEKVYERFSSQMLETSTHKFRTKDDIMPYIYRYWHLLSGDFYPKNCNDAYKNISPVSLESLNDIISGIESDENIRFTCFNDNLKLSEDEYNKIKERLQEYLEEKFPQKASFEL
ncbi:stealth conserved region 3 domain-containing protein [Pasteurella atlantica]|uniref:stealth conserved region 3 domain-containing protein n=1 Tax=Pasteurellaceae TaxID=712 RepID=UPI002750370F|nr:stealth conserved region 3 domain-containing protein [Pasteurella atlantica]MDP8032885.1 stealth conserved region 3 domain-containing protein [Pasteurella atlantica]MDP8034958.1 stealth conserved region 3 domain-containing protein [Pasteurella atlantica]MDP8036772.1 stealth conserved region 3 domain-containing protein [Pasteurella atlantica]MDP8047255.1 stealth conserved region 3 domain-containing protein [Pasteurella atlantica]MDP8049235.1 stealth conserved region 3 domain-containing prote